MSVYLRLQWKQVFFSLQQRTSCKIAALFHLWSRRRFYWGASRQPLSGSQIQTRESSNCAKPKQANPQKTPNHTSGLWVWGKLLPKDLPALSPKPKPRAEDAGLKDLCFVLPVSTGTLQIGKTAGAGCMSVDWFPSCVLQVFTLPIPLLIWNLDFL